MARVRADHLVVDQGLAPTRTRAQALIIAGVVFSGPDRKVNKSSDMFDATTELFLQNNPLPYVSRGGLKLAAALDAFLVEVHDKVCLDVGASTGGFTDCLLQKGARRVYAVDVGWGQLDWKLRQDPRVVLLERSNIRTLANDAITEKCSLIVIDTSFISLKIVIPAAMRFAAANANLVALVKPQFEVGPKAVSKGGIVRDEMVRKLALEEIKVFCQNQNLNDIRSIDSPILGAKGNHEFLLYACLL
ncbi:MAG: TlyA family RNA methyltransferase [Deltaproteobacteria bacterium]|nr:TlyA family RNA methyltransferase [Deltaproteobacteria bacterium]